MSRIFDDLPPIATDQELLDWAHELQHDTAEAGDTCEPRPQRDPNTMSLEELLLDIEMRATEVYERSHAPA